MFRLFKKSGIFYKPGLEIPLPDRISLADKKSSDSLESGKNRLLCTMFLFFGAFSVIAVRLIGVTLMNTPAEEHLKTGDSKTYALEIKMNRADIVDRNGVLLATSLPSADLYVDSEKIKNPETIAAALVQTLPDLEYKPLLKKLKSKKNFVYIKRNLTPKEQYDVNRLGFPQLNFQMTETRVYPQGPLVSHIIGTTDIDNKGIAGIEKTFNEKLSGKKETVRLSLDVGVQDSVRSVLMQSIETYQAEGAAAVLMNAKTGEIVSMVSLPDYDPNNLKNSRKKNLFNTVSLGVYEVGSIMKLFNTAIGLETKKITVDDKIDASHPVVLANYTINDVPKLRRVVTIPEILIHSSNIGSAKIALAVGSDKQQEFFRRFDARDGVELGDRLAVFPAAQQRFDVGELKIRQVREQRLARRGPATPRERKVAAVRGERRERAKLSGVPAAILEKVIDERFAQGVRARISVDSRRRDVFEKIQRRFLLAGGDQVLRDLQIDFLRIVPKTDPHQLFRRSRVVAARLHQLGAQIIRAGRSRDRFRREPSFELFEPTAQQRRLRRAEGERRAVALGKPGVSAELRLRLRQKIVLVIRKALAHEKRDVVRMRQRERQPFPQKFQRFAGTPLQEKRVRKKDAPFGIRRVLHQSGAHEHQRAARIALQFRVLDQRVGVRRAPRAPHVLRKRIKQHFRIPRVLELAHGAIPPQQQRAESQIRQRDENGKRRRNAPPVETQRPATVRKPTVSGKPEINTVVEFHGLERK